jgi:hypothetical protein
MSILNELTDNSSFRGTALTTDVLGALIGFGTPDDMTYSAMQRVPECRRCCRIFLPTDFSNALFINPVPLPRNVLYTATGLALAFHELGEMHYDPPYKQNRTMHRGFEVRNLHIDGRILPVVLAAWIKDEV